MLRLPLFGQRIGVRYRQGNVRGKAVVKTAVAVLIFPQGARGAAHVQAKGL